MAKKKMELGVVKKIYDSGNIETNKGHIVHIKAEHGDRLLFDEDTREVTIAPKKTNSRQKPKVAKSEDTEQKVNEIVEENSDDE